LARTLLPRHADLGPYVARTAVGLCRSHPHVPVLDVLDVVMRQRCGSLSDFGAAIEPATPVGDLLATAFDKGMAPGDWHLAARSETAPAVVAALLKLWRSDVLPLFAARYGLAP
jgi:hypothetical protein